MRDSHKEYERRKVQPLVVMAQHPFQLQRPKTVDKEWGWPDEIPTGVVFDPVSTASAAYGVAFQTQVREGQGPWSSRPAIFVIDADGVLRYTDSRPDQDLHEVDFFPILDDLDEQRRLITALRGREALREALRDRDGSVRASAAEALKKIDPEAVKKAGR